MSKFNNVTVSHTRAQALEDGVLVDVSETAREAGFPWPVAVTSTVWELVKAIPLHAQEFSSIGNRLWGMLRTVEMAFYKAPSGFNVLYCIALLSHGHEKHLLLKLVTGPGDHGEPVVTIMLPDED